MYSSECCSGLNEESILEAHPPDQGHPSKDHPARAGSTYDCTRSTRAPTSPAVHAADFGESGPAHTAEDWQQVVQVHGRDVVCDGSAPHLARKRSAGSDGVCRAGTPGACAHAFKGPDSTASQPGWLKHC